MASPLKLEQYDVVICGGGTAGCVLAARLTEDPNVTVLLLEAGENANDDIRVKIPGLFPLCMDNPELDWQFMAETSPAMNNRRMAFPRGKCLGGTSAINIMGLIYPSKAGLDAWAELGNPGWDWEGMAPYYRKFQRLCPPPREVAEALGLDYLDPKVQGTDGPICSSYPSSLRPLEKAWVDTWKGLHKTITGDPMAGVHTGGYTAPASIDPQKGERTHSGNAYYAPASTRTNLHLITGAMIDKVELDAQNLDSVIATGVSFFHQGTTYTAHARKEVILAAGTFGSPSILERSGVGSAYMCDKLGITNVIANSNVGENLQDHLMLSMSFEVVDGVTTADTMRDPSNIQTAMEEYHTSRSGPLAAGGSYSFAYTPLTDFLPNSFDTKEDIPALLDKFKPHSSVSRFQAEKLHYAFNRRILESPQEASACLCFICVQMDGSQLAAKDLFGLSQPENYVTLLPQLAHPFSRGCVHITSKDANTHPKIEPKFLSHPLDAEILARHAMQGEIVAASPPLNTFLKKGGRRLPDGKNALTLDAARDFVKHSATSNYHPSGTCAMMPVDLGGVVDERLRVHGTKNLRVCDASVFPIQVRGNIQSTVYAVAEKCADIVKEDLGRSLGMNGSHL